MIAKKIITTLTLLILHFSVPALGQTLRSEYEREVAEVEDDIEQPKCPKGFVCYKSEDIKDIKNVIDGFLDGSNINDVDVDSFEKDVMSRRLGNCNKKCTNIDIDVKCLDKCNKK